MYSKLKIADGKEKLSVLKDREAELLSKVSSCFYNRVDDIVCGMNANEAPNPWIALDGQPCQGYETLSTREYDYCGYCVPPYPPPPLCIRNPQTACNDVLVVVVVAHRGLGRQP